MNSTIWSLLQAFSQIGLFSIGGGYAVIPMIQQQVVDCYGWISEQTFLDIVAISQMTPGPLAVNTSTFVGLRVGGISGAVAATAGCVCAGILLSLLLYRFFRKRRNSLRAAAALGGLRAASTGLIASAALSILLLTFCGTSDFTAIRSLDWRAAALVCAALILLRKKKAHPLLVMGGCGLAGLFLWR